MRRHLQFDDQNYMDCASMNDFLSSSSLSSSDSEAVLTNETDHEGDDELTDWPGNEVMINFTSKCDFKRINKIRAKPTLPLIKQHEDTIQDDDTLMCADDCGTENPAGITYITKIGVGAVFLHFYFFRIIRFAFE